MFLKLLSFFFCFGLLIKQKEKKTERIMMATRKRKKKPEANSVETKTKRRGTARYGLSPLFSKYLVYN